MSARAGSVVLVLGSACRCLRSSCSRLRLCPGCFSPTQVDNLLSGGGTKVAAESNKEQVKEMLAAIPKRPEGIGNNSVKFVDAEGFMTVFKECYRCGVLQQQGPPLLGGAVAATAGNARSNRQQHGHCNNSSGVWSAGRRCAGTFALNFVLLWMQQAGFPSHLAQLS